MASIRDVAAYLCRHYPHKAELSKARLTKLVYLADWESAKRTGKTLTNIVWKFHNYGPYVDDVMNVVKRDDAFDVEYTHNTYGEPKALIDLKDDEAWIDLTQSEEEIIDKVINDTRHMYWNAFMNHVYSTYPIRIQDRYSELDLEDLAVEYNRLKSVSGRA